MSSLRTSQRTSRKRWTADHTSLSVAYAVVIIATIVVSIPVLWIVLSSLKTDAGIRTYPPQWWPDPVSLRFYLDGLFASRVPSYLLNSLYVAVASVLLTLFVGAHAGYATARFQFPGKGALLFILLASQMIPGIALLVPYYLIATSLGLYDTHAVLIIIYTAWQGPVVTWVMKAFFETIPKELDQAALIDGCSPLGAFYRVVLPLVRPGLAASAILTFVYVWNEFLIAHVLTLSADKRLLTPSLYLFRTQWGIEWGSLTAAVVIALLPVVVMFLILQRQFVEGLAAGAVKG